MTEAYAASAAVELPAGSSALPQRLMRLKRTSRLIGLVGARQALPMLAERVANPNADREHTLQLSQLEYPFCLTSAHSDIAMLNEIVGMRVYDLPGLDEFIDGLPIVDIGSNIGVSAALFASRYPHSSVTAIEPHPRNFSFLARNAELYGDRITPIEKAIGLEEGRVGLGNPEEAKLGRHAVYEFRENIRESAVMADVLTPEVLDASLPQTRIGLMKINIEGEEKDLLASRRMDPLLQRTNVAIIEAHDRKLSGTSEIVLAAAARSDLALLCKRGSFYLFSNT